MVNAQSLQFDGCDCYCDVALPQATDPDVVPNDGLGPTTTPSFVGERDGAAAVLTHLGHHQDSKHRHVHSGLPRRKH